MTWWQSMLLNKRSASQKRACTRLAHSIKIHHQASFVREKFSQSSGTVVFLRVYSEAWWWNAIRANEASPKLDSQDQIMWQYDTKINREQPLFIGRICKTRPPGLSQSFVAKSLASVASVSVRIRPRFGRVKSRSRVTNSRKRRVKEPSSPFPPQDSALSSIFVNPKNVTACYAGNGQLENLNIALGLSNT